MGRIFFNQAPFWAYFTKLPPYWYSWAHSYPHKRIFASPWICFHQAYLNWWKSSGFYPFDRSKQRRGWRGILLITTRMQLRYASDLYTNHVQACFRLPTTANCALVGEHSLMHSTSRNFLPQLEIHFQHLQAKRSTNYPGTSIRGAIRFLLFPLIPQQLLPLFSHVHTSFSRIRSAIRQNPWELSCPRQGYLFF